MSAHRNDAVEKQLLRALTKLQRTDIWLEIFTENLLYAKGIEGFFQRSLLWAFNTLEEQDYWADIEQPVEGLRPGETVDFLVYQNREPLNQEILESGQSFGRRRWLQVGEAFVEMKHSPQCSSIESDVGKLRAVAVESRRQQNGEKAIYELLLHRMLGPSQRTPVGRPMISERERGRRCN